MKSAAKKPVTAKKKSAKKRPRIRNPEQTRAKLLKATIDLLAAKGPDALSLKEAARLAEVSRGVAYQHFEDRDHLLREAKSWMSDQLMKSAEECRPAASIDTFETNMHDSIASVARLVLSNREAARLLITDALAGKALEKGHPLFEAVNRVLIEFRNSGRAQRDFDIEMQSFIMLGVVSSLIMLSNLPHSESVDALAERFTREWTQLLREGLIVKAQPKSGQKPRGMKGKSSTNARSGKPRR